jgi:hypothetical protein
MNQYRQEHESTEAWLNRVEVHMNSILECSNNKDILYERKLCLNTTNGDIISEKFKMDGGKELLKIITPDVDVVMSSNNFNDNFWKCFKNKTNFDPNQMNIHTHDTRSKNKYLNEYMTITINYPVQEWQETGFYEHHQEVLNSIIKFMESLHPDVKNFTNWESIDDTPIIIHTDNLTRTGKMMFYTSPIGMINAIAKGRVSDIITAINNGYNDTYNTPEPERMSLLQYNQVIGVKNAQKKDTIHTCSICMEDIKIRSRISVTKCCHYFHSKCLKKWLVNKCSEPVCPCCRQHLSNSD